ncbi:hypothetical protein BBB57_17805 [Kosakonia sacchari]|uniref:hypothetical protein n=1 Tax=Enterobacteriaceae TaxID=543 RepID=UPI00034EF845|nr:MULTISPECIES: hypothetical protein [Enterobacteriaceae]AGN85298.1 hypothetical protein H650_09040 [Enterobacter sp. R4-368]ANR79940.1 hypothetical protein BBB57_17805 [Kosakonia sacchari]MCZ3383846.1 hypothetical protein [Kosakonia sp. SOY2]
MKVSTGILTLLLCAITFPSLAAAKQSELTCKAQAITEANKLLAFYRDNDDRAEVDKDVTALAKMQNPENKSQYFDVLQTWGYIYKGKYRMRFIFLNDCTLMGEEILEYANP